MADIQDCVFDRYGEEIARFTAPAAIAQGLKLYRQHFPTFVRRARSDGSLSYRLRIDPSQPVRTLDAGSKRVQVADLLASRPYVIVQSPPGIGKALPATELLQQEYVGRGRSIQFHPNTYFTESFIGGRPWEHGR
jgi:hypothetical protein